MVHRKVGVMLRFTYGVANMGRSQLSYVGELTINDNVRGNVIFEAEDTVYDSSIFLAPLSDCCGENVFFSETPDSNPSRCWKCEGSFKWSGQEAKGLSMSTSDSHSAETLTREVEEFVAGLGAAAPYEQLLAVTAIQGELSEFYRWVKQRGNSLFPREVVPWPIPEKYISEHQSVPPLMDNLLVLFRTPLDENDNVERILCRAVKP